MTLKKNMSFVLCIKNTRCKASLELRKIYIALSDEQAEKRKMIRVIDESGEDYLHPADFFVPLDLPKRIEHSLAATF